MKVWHLLSNRWNSAITEYALSTARALQMGGHQNVFTPLTGSPAAARAQEAGLETRVVAGFTVGTLMELRRLAREIKPDVVISYGGPETTWGRFLGVSREALFLRFRGQPAAAPGVLERMRYRLSHGHVGILLTPSHSLAQDLESLDPTKPVETVILGCDASKFRRIQPHAAPMRPEAVVLGRLDPVKGHAVLFKIFALMKSRWTKGPVPRLHIVGEVANLTVSDLKAEASRVGLVVGEDVVFTDQRVAAIGTLLSAAALGIVPSTGSEIIARVAEEFLLCGTPILVSGVGSLEETLFADAGASYRGLDDAKAADLLKAWLEKSLAEGEEAKVRRAHKAQQVFSLEAMGKALEVVLKSPASF